MTEPATTETTQTEQTPATEPAATAAPLTYAADAPPPAPPAEPPPPDYSALKVPEGYVPPGSTLESLREVALAHKVPFEVLQAQVDALAKANAEVLAQSDAEAAEREARWAAELKADPQFGGAKHDETIAQATRFVTRYGGEPLLEFLKGLGAAGFPPLIRAFAKAERDTGEAPVLASTRDAPADTGVIFDYSKSRAA